MNVFIFLNSKISYEIIRPKKGIKLSYKLENFLSPMSKFPFFVLSCMIENLWSGSVVNVPFLKSRNNLPGALKLQWSHSCIIFQPSFPFLPCFICCCAYHALGLIYRLELTYFDVYSFQCARKEGPVIVLYEVLSQMWDKVVVLYASCGICNVSI